MHEGQFAEIGKTEGRKTGFWKVGNQDCYLGLNEILPIYLKMSVRQCWILFC